MQPSWKRDDFDRPFDGYAARSSGQAGAAYGAVHRARGSYSGYLSEPVPAQKMLWWNREMAPKTIGPTNRFQTPTLNINSISNSNVNCR